VTATSGAARCDTCSGWLHIGYRRTVPSCRTYMTVTWLRNDGQLLVPLQHPVGVHQPLLHRRRAAVDALRGAIQFCVADAGDGIGAGWFPLPMLATALGTSVCLFMCGLDRLVVRSRAKSSRACCSVHTSEGSAKSEIT